MEWVIAWKEKDMVKKISMKIVLLQLFFIAVILGISMILYDNFMPVYYEQLKDKQIMQAYHDINEIDLDDLMEDDFTFFLSYEENENLRFYIADADLNRVYCSLSNENAFQKNVANKKFLFSRNPKIVRKNDKYKRSASLRGILTQNGKDYYVMVREVAMGTSTLLTIGKFYVFVFAILALFGSAVLFFILLHLLLPAKRLFQVSDKIVAGNYEEKAQEDSIHTEVNYLAHNVNQMSEQLQKQKSRIEDNKQQLLRRNVRQERVEKMRKEYVASISHELKTPLAVISSQAEMLEYVEEDKEYYIASIQEEVTKMTEMVSRLLEHSVMEHQMENMVQKKLDMKEIMEYISMKYEGLVKKKRLNLETFFSEGCFIYGDREYIEQAVNNFMMNALEYTNIGGNIRMTLKKQDKSIRVGVYNEGSRIREEDKERIWSGYYRNPVESEYEKNGFSHAGLGLYNVQSIVTMHGGAYGVENLSSGVEFWFTLPEA